MQRNAKLILAGASVIALTACGDRQILDTFNSEAGGFLDRRGTFGDATLNNTQFQNGERSFAVSLNRRFREEVQATVNFPFNSAALDGDAQAILDVQASWIKQFPEVRFKVYGHTDLVGSAAANKRLGQQRANAVVNYLIGKGISRKRLEAVVSFGETRPLIYTEDRERQNRRTVTEVAGVVQGNPRQLDGNYAQILYREYVESATEVPPDEAGATGLPGIGGG